MTKHLPDTGRAHTLITRVLTILAALTILGCTTGRTRMSDMQEAQVRAFVEQNYENLMAYYSGNRERPGAILMDLKNDSVTLIAKKWEPINSKDEVHKLMDLMETTYYRRMKGAAGVYGPRLQRVQDEKNNLIGYFFSPVDNWPVRRDGSNYSVDPVTYGQVLEWSEGEVTGPGRRIMR